MSNDEHASDTTAVGVVRGVIYGFIAWIVFGLVVVSVFK